MPYLSLEVVKDHLRESGAQQDLRLPRFINTAERMVVEHCGHVLPIDVVEDVETDEGPDGLSAQLHELPVLTVQQVQLAPDARVLAAADRLRAVDGWTLRDARSGLLGLGRARTRLARVTYRAGRAATPDLITTGTLELVQHLWRASQNRVGPGQQGVFDRRPGEQPRSYPMSFAMPRAVLEIIGPELLPQALG